MRPDSVGKPGETYYRAKRYLSTPLVFKDSIFSEYIPGNMYFTDVIEFYRHQPIGLLEKEISQFNIFPNPAGQFIRIQSPKTDYYRQIIITDHQGKQVMEISNPSQTLNISKLKIGAYILKVITDEEIAVKGFIKQ